MSCNSDKKVGFKIGRSLRSRSSYDSRYDCRSVVFLKKRKKLVAGFADFIGIWDFENIESKHQEIDLGDFNTSQVIEWNDESVIACGATGKIVWIENPAFKEAIELYDSKTTVPQSDFLRMAKISDDLFLVIDARSEQLSIFSFSKRDLIRNVGEISVQNYSKLELSKQHVNSVYINVGIRLGKGVILYNYEKGETMCTFEEDSEWIDSIAVYKDQDGDEILVCCGSFLTVYFYSVKHCITNDGKSKAFKKISKLGEYGLRNSLPFLISNRYLTICDENCSLFIVDVFQDFKIYKKKVFSTQGDSIVSLCVVDKRLSEIDLVLQSTSIVEDMKLVTVTGLEITDTDDDLIQKDLIERIEYLRDQIFLDDHKVLLCDLKISNSLSIVCFRSIL